VPGNGVRGRQTVAGLLAGIPLRARLVAAACCLTAAGAAIISLACSLTARAGLLSQADQQLQGCAGSLTSGPFTATPADSGPCAGGAFVIDVASGGQLVMRTGPGPGPALAAIPGTAGRPAIVPGASGSWLVVAEPVHYSARHIPFTYGYDSFSVQVTSTARPGTPGTLVVALNLSGVSQAITSVNTDCAAVSGAAVLGVAALGLAAISIIWRPLAELEEAAARAVANASSPKPVGATDGPSAWLLSELAGTCGQLRRPASLVQGLAEYHRQRGPLPAAELDRMMGQTADELARADVLIDRLEDLARPTAD